MDCGLHDPELIERLPMFNASEGDIWNPFVFGMRYITPTVIRFYTPTIVIRDLSQRRCVRANKEERDFSDEIYVMTRTY